MQVMMFSKEMLTNETRANFELPVWPYREGAGKVPPEFRDYLKHLTVFRYEDDYIGERAEHLGAILVPDKDGSWAHEWESPIQCYEHRVAVDNNTLAVIPWPNDDPQGYALHDEIVKKTGDNLAWARFNKSVVLHKCTSQFVHYLSGHDAPPTIGKVGEIRL